MACKLTRVLMFPQRSFSKQRAAIEREYGQVSGYSCPLLAILLEPFFFFYWKCFPCIDLCCMFCVAMLYHSVNNDSDAMTHKPEMLPYVLQWLSMMLTSTGLLILGNLNPDCLLWPAPNPSHLSTSVLIINFRQRRDFCKIMNLLDG